MSERPMSEELANWHPENSDSRADKEEAQDEANMMQAKLGVNPHTGEVKKNVWELNRKDEILMEVYNLEPTRELTANDYQRAFEAIEEMKRLADEEPNSRKTILRVLQLIDKNPVIAMLGMGSRNLERNVGKDKEDVDGLFDDAAERLRNMEKKGADFAKRQSRVA